MVVSPFHLPNFRWLWLGQTLILCASQFWFVALTWLVLQKTQSGLALGMVLMAAAIPRGLFMLLGGVISDRWSTQRVVTTAVCLNSLLVGTITGMQWLDQFHLPSIATIAALSGCVEAFLYPGLMALLPQIISKPRLGSANAWMQGSEQITNVIGPAAAGIVIGTVGLPIAFLCNTILFLVGGGLIYLLRLRGQSQPIQQNGASLAGEMVEGIRYAWNRPAIRTSLLLIAMINFAVLGPMVIGVADMVTVRFGGSATLFGYLQAAYGVGAFLGVLIASRLSAIKDLKMPLLWLSGLMGLGLIALGFITQAWLAAIVIALMGIGGGIVGVLGLTWLQQQTIKPMQGRMMSLVMFAAVALDPLSQALSGLVLEASLAMLFVIAGIIMLGTAIIPTLRQR